MLPMRVTNPVKQVSPAGFKSGNKTEILTMRHSSVPPLLGAAGKEAFPVWGCG